MVFYDNRRRRHRAQKPKTTPKSLQDLPDELHLKILEQVPIVGVLKLRETSKAFVGVCSDALRARVKVLYIHPSPSSVRKAITICQSDLSSEIQEICFVSKIMWQIIRQRESAGRRPQAIHLASSWPFLTAQQDKPSSQDECFPGATFSDAYSFLLSTLAGLPKVRAFSFTDTCDRPGFNMLPKTRIQEYAEAIQPVVLSKEKRAESKLYHHREPAPSDKLYRFMDADAVLSILSHPEIQLTKLRVTDELPYADAITNRCTIKGIRNSSEYSICQAKLQHLTTIELHCNTGWDRTSWQQTCHSILSLAAPNLQSLKLAFQHNAAVKRPRADLGLLTILAGLEFPSLTHLELTALQPIHRNRRHYRPICQDFDFVQFLTAHSAKLRTLHFSNVLFASATTPRPLLHQIRDVIELCGELGMGLSWIVNYFTHDPRCDVMNAPSGASCSHHCFTYCPTSHGAGFLTQFETLAIELGVVKDEKTSTWDFAKVDWEEVYDRGIGANDHTNDELTDDQHASEMDDMGLALLHPTPLPVHHSESSTLASENALSYALAPPQAHNMARKKRAADSDESAPRKKAKATTNTAETTKPSDATTLRTTRSMKRTNTVAARQAVLQTNELLDAILVNLPMKQLFVAQRVCKRFKAVIAATPAIQEKMFLRSKKEEDLEVWTMLGPERKCTPLAFNPMLVPDQSDWYEAMSSGEAIESWLNDPTLLRDQTRKSFLHLYITNPPCRKADVWLVAEYGSHSSGDRALLKYGFYVPIHVELEHGLTFKDLLDAAMNKRASWRGFAGWRKGEMSVDLDLNNKTIGQVVDRLEGYFGRAMFVHLNVKVPNAITPGLDDWTKVRAGSWEGGRVEQANLRRTGWSMDGVQR
ncbi:hypothetical protein Q7P37_010212 [Cladosporium fusiforme]